MFLATLNHHGNTDETEWKKWVPFLLPVYYFFPSYFVPAQILIIIGMAWLSVYINNVSIILSSNQLVQESDLLIIFNEGG